MSKLLLFLLLALIIPSAIAANDPGHDSLYVLNFGNSNIVGSLNITNTLNASNIRAAALLYGDQLDIRANGTVLSVSNRPAIQADANDLYVDAKANLYFNTKGGTTNIVQIGPTTGSSIILNVSGEIRQANLNVCLEDGTNCPSSSPSAATNAGWLNTSTQVYLASNSTNVSIGNATGFPILFADTHNGRVGVLSQSPSTALDVNGTITATTFSGAGTGLTGTASGLSIGGSAASATTATTATSANQLLGQTPDFYLNRTGFDAGNVTSGTLAVARGGTGVTTSSGSGSVVLNDSPYINNPIVTGTGSVTASSGVFTTLTRGGSNVCTSDGNNCPTSGATNAGWLNTSTQVHLVNNVTNLSVGNTSGFPVFFVDTRNGRAGVLTQSPSSSLDVNGTITATTFSGAGTGLTGTASGLSIGGSAASATTATTATSANQLLGQTPDFYLNRTGFDAGNVTSGTLAVARGGTGVTTSSGSGSVVLNDSPYINDPTITGAGSITASTGEFTTLTRAGVNVCTSDGTNCPSSSGGAASGWLNTSSEVYLALNGTNVSIANVSHAPVLFVDTTSREVGIGTATPLAALDVRGGAFLVNGSTGGTPTSGGGTRLMWVPSKGALRAGTASNSEWDDAQLGQDSAALGQGARATGDTAFATGGSTFASGAFSTAMGVGAQAYGFVAFAAGYNPIATGSYAIALGLESNASGTASLGAGTLSSAGGLYSTSLGYNAVNNASYGGAAIGGRLDIQGNASFGIGYGLATAINAQNSIVLGSGVVTSTLDGVPQAYLNNTIPRSLMIGFNSSYPILFANGTNIGIGTTIPEGTLNVNGTINVSGTSPTIYVGSLQVCLSDGTNCPAGSSGYQNEAGGWVNDTTTTRTALTTYVNNSQETGSFIVQNSSNDVHLFVNGSSGFIGIGTATPGISLTVKSIYHEKIRLMGDPAATGGNSEAAYMSFYGNASRWGYMGFTSNGTNNLEFVNSKNGTARIVLDSKGEFGINESDPNQALTVKGAANITGPVLLENTKCGSGQVLTTNSATGLVSCTSATGAIAIAWTNDSSNVQTLLRTTVNNSNISGSFIVQNQTNSIHLFVNGSNGFVGINTSGPVTPLHVNGTVTATTFSGAGTGLTGTASGLSIGGSAASATTATTATSANQLLGQTPDFYLNRTGFNAGNVTSGTLAVAVGGTGTTTSSGSGSVVLNVSPYIHSPTITGTGSITAATGTFTSLTRGGLGVCTSDGVNCPSVSYQSSAAGFTNASGWINISNRTTNLSMNGLFVDNTNWRVGVGTEIPSGAFQVYTSFASAGERPFFKVNSSSPTGSVGDYNMGYNFTMNSTGQITTLWARVYSTQPQTIRLYDSSGRVIAQGNVTGGGIFSAVWVGVNITPVTVYNGSTYIVAVRTGSSGGYYQEAGSYPQQSGNVFIRSCVYASATDNVPSTTIGGMYGQADFTFVPFNQSDASALMVTPGGNVGIGTTAPTQKLDVNGTVNISGGNSLYVATICLSGTCQSSWPSGGGGGGGWINTTTTVLLNSNSTNVTIGYVSSIPTAYFDNLNGRLGIGTTTPSAPVEIYKSSSGIDFQGLKITNAAGNVNSNVSILLAGNSGGTATRLLSVQYRPNPNGVDVGAYSGYEGATTRFSIGKLDANGLYTTPNLVVNVSSGGVGINNGTPSITSVLTIAGNTTYNLQGTITCFEKFIGTTQNYTRCINSSGAVTETIGTFAVN